MKFDLNWLAEHLEFSASAAEISEKLTSLGLEVEGVQDKATELAGFIVAEVKEAEKHPNADRLKLCKVWNGKEELQVVCGAPNARAGIKVVYAPIGVTIPKSGIVIKDIEIRKVKSSGMLCSADELGVGEDAGGIIELPLDSVVGSPAAKALGADTAIFDIALTPDRVDCAGVRGVARDLAAAGLGKLKDLKVSDVKGKFRSPVNVKLDFASGKENACNHFIGVYIKNVKNNQSPAWLQDRLKAAGLRPISALVDITNYFSLGYCRPLHVFDADKLNGNITVRLAKSGEELIALDGKTYALDAEMTVIADDKSVLALAGVMGGEATGCTETTRNVFLEVAYFDPDRTAQTGRKAGIVSDARYRFERGIDPLFQADAAKLATQMILDICDGEASEEVVAGAPKKVDRVIDYNPGKCLSFGGMDVDPKEQIGILKALGFEVNSEDKNWKVYPPSWRGDVEGAADIIGDVLRVKGYGQIKSQHVYAPTPVSTKPFLSEYRQRMINGGRLLASRGLYECVTWSFLSEKIAADFSEIKPELRIINPISADLDYMRPSIIPNLLSAAKYNGARGSDNVAFFEVGPVFNGNRPEDQEMSITVLRAGEAVGRQWNEKARPADFFDAKADLFSLLPEYGVKTEKLKLEANAPSYYHTGRSASVSLKGKVIAYLGEIHPVTLKEFDLSCRAVAFELFPNRIPAQRAELAKPLLKIPELHAVYRDFAFLVDAAKNSEEILKAARAANDKLIVDAQIFDLYTGKGIEDGKKSLAIVVKIQPTDKALTDSEIVQISEAVVQSVGKATGAVLR